MFRLLKPSVVVRNRLAVAAALTVPMLALSGCRHHRSAMRPVYVGPPVTVEAAPACPTGDCGAAPAILTPEPAFSDPARLTSPPPPLPLTDPNVVPQAGPEPILDPATPGASMRSSPKLEPPSRTSSSMVPAKPAVGRDRSVLRHDLSTRANDPVDLFTPPRAERPWRYVVLHHSGEPLGSLASLDDKGRERLGTHDCAYHFVIGNGSGSPDGQIEVARRWSEQRTGAHARDSDIPEANEYGIGICLVGDLDQRAPTAKQVESARILVSYLQNRYNIPSSRVLSHADLARNSRPDCPGRLFPMQAVVNDRAFASR